jgi:hypothetical protein
MRRWGISTKQYKVSIWGGDTPIKLIVVTISLYLLFEVHFVVMSTLSCFNECWL